MNISTQHKEFINNALIEWWGWDNNGVKYLHRDNGPAYIVYYLEIEESSVFSESYHYNNLCHRLDGPAVIYYNEDGSIREQWYCLLGRDIPKLDFDKPGFIDAFVIEHS